MTMVNPDSLRNLHLFKSTSDNHKFYLTQMLHDNIVITYKHYPKLKLVKVLYLIDLILLNGTVDEEIIEQYISIYYPELFTKHNKSSTIRLIADYVPFAIHILLTT